ncbi:hypothetical protein B9Z55_027387 [Caenorhabditis nigoni]|uniref:Morc S5 domain-containing protein n=1 Tax=Caenorhabditis nigoni TaxID=1611254 RepID=A0A2G5SGD2_9PELO|nr:hypothetical protein B9Z55_027387 [Caenorhabditis nigoni]
MSTVHQLPQFAPNNERIEILDDGDGMTRSEALSVVKFGFFNKVDNEIGRYGMGLKSGGLYPIFGIELSQGLDKMKGKLLGSVMTGPQQQEKIFIEINKKPRVLREDI